MKFFSVFFLIAFGLPCYALAQNQQKEQLTEYFQIVHRAAVAVCKGEMGIAKDLYSSAIFNAAKTFSIDLNNAVYAEVHSAKPDMAKIKFYLQKLQAKGVCVHEKYRKKANILQYTHLVDESACKKVKSEQERSIMLRVIKDDQSIRDTLINSRSKRSPDLPKVIRRLYAVDSANYQIVLGILNRASNQQIPLQEYIGMEAYYHAMVVIHHYSEQKYEAKKIFKMAAEGILDPRNVFSNFDDEVQRGYIRTEVIGGECGKFQPFGTTSIIQTFPEIIIKIPPDSCLSKINELRKKYYMQDLIEECKIKAYAQYNTQSGFDYPIIYQAIDAAYLQEIERKIREKYKIIKYRDENDYDFNRGY